ncbi:MAG: hypothetical protein H0W64_09195 [Gammaproteobacteria bacterium]|nr:hypothetical protein [Gammaproteobacteria bacterium]
MLNRNFSPKPSTLLDYQHLIDQTDNEKIKDYYNAFINEANLGNYRSLVNQVREYLTNNKSNKTYVDKEFQLECLRFAYEHASSLLLASLKQLDSQANNFDSYLSYAGYNCLNALNLNYFDKATKDLELQRLEKLIDITNAVTQVIKKVDLPNLNLLEAKIAQVKLKTKPTEKTDQSILNSSLQLLFTLGLLGASIGFTILLAPFLPIYPIYGLLIGMALIGVCETMDDLKKHIANKKSIETLYPKSTSLLSSLHDLHDIKKIKSFEGKPSPSKHSFFSSVPKHTQAPSFPHDQNENDDVTLQGKSF